MKKIAITIGDPAGVGPEVVEKALAENESWRDSLVLIGEQSWCRRMQDLFGVEFVSVGELPRMKLGEPTVEGAKLALTAMDCSAEGCIDGDFSAVVTGPISKHWCQKAGMIHPGQTEFFASKWGGEPTMAFHSASMVVSLVTWHVPLMKVWENLSEDSISRTITHTVDLLRKTGIENPRIGVCGFNPHAGEDGQIGWEEIDVLNPILNKLRTTGYELSNCLPSDTVFYRHLQGEFDAVVALYHDQALAPVKTVAFHDAVNVTLGLPHVRTSPDHGTAFGIAGKGEANPESMMSAIRLAMRLV